VVPLLERQGGFWGNFIYAFFVLIPSVWRDLEVTAYLRLGDFQRLARNGNPVANRSEFSLLHKE
jgi:hypothetical protein